MLVPEVPENLPDGFAGEPSRSSPAADSQELLTTQGSVFVAGRLSA